MQSGKPPAGVVEHRAKHGGPLLDGWRGAILPLLICTPLFLWRLILLFSPLPLCDFMTYWAAARLFLSGGDPYSSGAIFAMEHALGWSQTAPLVLLNPPWALPFIAVVGLIPFTVAHYLCFAISIALEAVCALTLWSYFGGDQKQRWIALVLLASFVPASGAEHLVQVTPLMLLGLTGLLLALRSQRYLLGGVCLLVLGLKPHLLYLVLLAVVFWAIQGKRWSLLASAAVLTAAASISAIAFNHNVLHYSRATVQAAINTPCGVGGVLRSIFGTQHAWLQFLPCAIGAAWFFVYWMRHRHAWKWDERLPLLLLVSLGSAPYMWTHDFVLGLPAILALAVKVSRARSYWPIAATSFLLVQAVVVEAGKFSAAWMATACLLFIVVYQFGSRIVTPERTVQADMIPKFNPAPIQSQGF